jgi:thiamine-phosphate diphosphorylase
VLPSALYPIVDPDALGDRGCVDTTAAILAGGARLVQLRIKNRPVREILATAEALRRLTADAGAMLVINDRVDVALAVGADAVHLGDDDLPIAVVRIIAGHHLLIGRSTHSLADARAASAAGADYIGFGPMFPTTTKMVAAPPQGLARLRTIRAAVDVPVVAIGGITETRARAVLEAGADAVAMIGELATASDITAKVRRVLEATCAA